MIDYRDDLRVNWFTSCQLRNRVLWIDIMPVSTALYGFFMSEMSVDASVRSCGAKGWFWDEYTNFGGSAPGCAVISCLQRIMAC